MKRGCIGRVSHAAINVRLSNVRDMAAAYGALLFLVPWLLFLASTVSLRRVKPTMRLTPSSGASAVIPSFSMALPSASCQPLISTATTLSGCGHRLLLCCVDVYTFTPSGYGSYARVSHKGFFVARQFAGSSLARALLCNPRILHLHVLPASRTPVSLFVRCKYNCLAALIMQGADVLFPDGYDRMINSSNLGKNIDIRLNSNVVSIDYSNYQKIVVRNPPATSLPRVAPATTGSGHPHFCPLRPPSCSNAVMSNAPICR